MHGLSLGVLFRGADGWQGRNQLEWGTGYKGVGVGLSGYSSKYEYLSMHRPRRWTCVYKYLCAESNCSSPDLLLQNIKACFVQQAYVALIGLR